MLYQVQASEGSHKFTCDLKVLENMEGPFFYHGCLLEDKINIMKNGFNSNEAKPHKFSFGIDGKNCYNFYNNIEKAIGFAADRVLGKNGSPTDVYVIVSRLTNYCTNDSKQSEVFTVKYGDEADIEIIVALEFIYKFEEKLPKK